MPRSLAYVLLVVVAACERSPKKSAPAPAPAPAPVVAAGSSNTAADQVSADARASITEFLDYSESVYTILHDHLTDCDATAKLLEARAPVFMELGPRMMKVKAAMMALPEADRERIKHESEALMAGFQKKHPDAEALDQQAKDCETKSPAFAAIAPKVMFQRKK